jgi:hypothetical protein
MAMAFTFNNYNVTYYTNNKRRKEGIFYSEISLAGSI